MTDLAAAERLLGHPVLTAAADSGSGIMVVASVAGDPPATRIAWIDWRAPAVIARLSCPPGRPSRVRPLVATDVAVAQGGIDERLLAVRTADGVSAVQPVTATEEPAPPVPVTGGVALARLDGDAAVLAVDALAPGGEPVGRLVAAGIGALTLTAGRITGRLGAGHGMAAGFGAGRWTDDAADAAFELGQEVLLPGWVPEGLARGAFHVEPDVAYPAAPPSVAVAWGAEPRRVLLRQTAAPLATPEVAHARSRTVTLGGGTPAVLMSRRRFATLVWETPERAFGLQVSGVEDPGEAAVRVAASL